MTLDIPNAITNGQGKEIAGSIPITLCTMCDHDTPGAGQLITLLTVNEQITRATAQEFASYAHEWADQVVVRIDPALQSEDEAAYRRGDFD